MPYRQIWRRCRSAAALVGMIALAAPLTGCLGESEPYNLGTPTHPATETYDPSLGINLSEMTVISDDLLYKDIVVGNGTQIAPGMNITATYTGWLTNGTVFDSNVGLSPIPVLVGAAQVIPGWDLGLPGMRVGGKRRLLIGSELAYGPYGYRTIPPNATLVFDVQIVTGPQ